MVTLPETLALGGRIIDNGINWRGGNNHVCCYSVGGGIVAGVPRQALFLCFEGGDGDCCHIKEIEFAKGDTPAPNPLIEVRIPGNIANGRIFAIPLKARYGESVKLTMFPESGFGLKLIRVRDEAGNNIEVNRNADIPHGSVSFNFHMPQSPMLRSGNITPCTKFTRKSGSAGMT